MIIAKPVNSDKLWNAKQKSKYIYKEDLKKFYDDHIEKSFDEVDLKQIFTEINVQN